MKIERISLCNYSMNNARLKGDFRYLEALTQVRQPDRFHDIHR